MNVGDSYRDLGGGLYEVPDGEPVPSMGEAMQSRDDGPSCPGCGLRGDVSEVNHPEGRYYCGTCCTLFNAVQQEWSGPKGHKRRELAKRHREDGYEPLEVQRIEKTRAEELEDMNGLGEAPHALLRRPEGGEPA